MSTEVDIRVTPALHPQNVKEIEGYDDETALVLGQTLTAFSEAYETLRGIHDAKAAAAKNPTLNDAARLLQVDDYATKRIDRVNRIMDAELARLNKAVEHLEQELSQPVTARASHPVAAEIRAHIKSLPAGQRMPFIRQAIESGDHDTAQAALGTVPYLSGLDANMQSVLVRMYHEKSNPHLAKRLKAMQGAKELIEKRGALAQAEAIKAVGYITDPKTQRKYYPKELRDARNAAELPFKNVA